MGRIQSLEGGTWQQWGNTAKRTDVRGGGGGGDDTQIYSWLNPTCTVMASTLCLPICPFALHPVSANERAYWTQFHGPVSSMLVPAALLWLRNNRSNDNVLAPSWQYQCLADTFALCTAVAKAFNFSLVCVLPNNFSWRRSEHTDRNVEL